MTNLEKMIQELCPNGVEYRELQEILVIKNGTDYKKLGTGSIPVYGSGGILAYVDTFAYDKPTVLIPRKGSIDKLYYVDTPFWNVDTIFYTVINESMAVPKYVYHCLLREHLEKYNTAGGVPSLTQKELNQVRIPVPPLAIQREIVHILDQFTERTTQLTIELEAEMAARKRLYEHYRDQLLKDNTGAEWMTLGDLGSVCMCKRIMKAETSNEGDVPFFKIGTFGKEPDAYISQEKYDEYRKKYSFPKKGDILISAAGTIGRTVIYDGQPAYYQDSNIVWLDNDESKVLNKYLYYYYQLQPWAVSTGGTIARLYNDNILKAKIAVPKLEEQSRIVSILDRLDAQTTELQTNITAEIESRRKQYEYYRDKLLTFPQAN